MAWGKVGVAVAVAAAVCSVTGVYTYKKEDMSNSVIAEHSFKAPFLVDWWQGGVPHWEPRGSTIVTNEAVRLTGALPSRVGAFVNTVPLQMDHWELTIHFRIHGRVNPGADGMALWYTQEPPTLGSLWGMNPNFKGFGLIFDTYDNNGKRDQPTISLIRNFEGEHRNWDESDDLLSSAVFRCSHEFRNSGSGEDPRVRIIYRYKKLEFFVKLHHNREFFCGQLERVVLPKGYFFSLAGKTGGAFDNHDVTSFVLTAAPGVVQKDKPEHPVFDPKNDAREKEKWSYSDE